MRPRARSSKPPAPARPPCEFYAVVTNPRRVQNPSSPAAALAAISSLLGFLHVLPAPAHIVEELIRLLRRRPVTGGDIFDLQILATMSVNGIERIYTFNARDFASFSPTSPFSRRNAGAGLRLPGTGLSKTQPDL